MNGEYQYAKHKIMNEWQAQDYTEIWHADANSDPPTLPRPDRCVARSIT